MYGSTCNLSLKRRRRPLHTEKWYGYIGFAIFGMGRYCCPNINKLSLHGLYSNGLPIWLQILSGYVMPKLNILICRV